MAKIKIDNALFDRAQKAAKVAGYSSVEEFVKHAIETRLETIEQVDTDEALDRQLKGLGYIE
jgi:hypothetical protein